MEVVRRVADGMNEYTCARSALVGFKFASLLYIMGIAGRIDSIRIL